MGLSTWRSDNEEAIRKQQKGGGQDNQWVERLLNSRLHEQAYPSRGDAANTVKMREGTPPERSQPCGPLRPFDGIPPDAFYYDNPWKEAMTVCTETGVTRGISHFASVQVERVATATP